MAKTQHTFAKRQRELEKKRKAEEKRARRQARKQAPETDTDTPADIENSETAIDTPTSSEAPGSSGPIQTL